MKTKLIATLAASAAAVLALSSCAGSTGNSSADTGTGDAFAFGASQEEVDAALEDLEPVTLNYQAAATSQNSIMAPEAQMYKEYVEDRSQGKITIDIVWGQAIAGYAELDDALADGRLDLAYGLPIYSPNDYPSLDPMSAALQSAQTVSPPIIGETVSNAVAFDIGWQNESLLKEYEAQGVVPLLPNLSGGSYYSLCTDPGTAPDDWEGRQVRVASSSHLGVVESLGASPVSLEYVELFEALQRGTVDCAINQMNGATEAGLVEVAPHIAHPSNENSFSGGTAGGVLAGSSFQQLPIAYQQILFDGTQAVFSGMVSLSIGGNAEAVRQSKAAGGTIEQFDQDGGAIIGQTHDEQLKAAKETGLLADDIEDRVQKSADKWRSVAEDLGIDSQTEFEDLDEAWEPGTVDFAPMAEQLFEEVALSHRPQ